MPDELNDPARGPLCQHIYPNGLRCAALESDRRHDVREDEPSPNRHNFEQRRCAHRRLDMHFSCITDEMRSAAQWLLDAMDRDELEGSQERLRNLLTKVASR